MQDSTYFINKEKYYVDNTNSNWYAFWIWNHYVRDESL